jgi:hypothetical protein
MRFVFCACAISYMLDDWSGVDVPAVVRYVNACLVRAVLPPLVRKSLRSGSL